MAVDFQIRKHLTKEYLLAVLSDIDSLHIEEKNEEGMLLWDDEAAKTIPVHFIERLSPSALSRLIHISSDIPSAYQIDKTVLAQYLLDACDKNAFITLEEMVVIWSEPDEPDTFDPSDFVDEQSKRLYEKYYDDYAYEIGSGCLGQLWFERNTVMINMGEIVRTAAAIAKENSDLFDPYFSFERQVEIGFLTTAIHELRHLQMDTNVFLPEDDYPLELGSEEAVEEYCRSAFESVYARQEIFPNLYEENPRKVFGFNTKEDKGNNLTNQHCHSSLDDKIKTASSKAKNSISIEAVRNYEPER